MMSAERRKNIPPKFEEMSEEQLRAIVKRKRECNSKALKLVESLLEVFITEEHFLSCLPDLNQSHLEDLFEERSIESLCGYPLCQNKLLSENIPKQKYKISTKTNKVYDITLRKKFCCNQCYKSGMYIKSQMLTSPLWFRDHEVIPEFKLLKNDQEGLLGEELDIAINKRSIIKQETESFISFKDFAQSSLMQMTECTNITDNCSEPSAKEDSNIDSDKSVETKDTLDAETPEKTLNQNNSHTNSEDCSKTKTAIEISNHAPKCADQTVEHNNENKPVLSSYNKPVLLSNAKQNVAKCVKLTNNNKPVSLSDAKQKVEKCLKEWITLDTLILIHGKDSVNKNISAERMADIQKSKENNCVTEKKYQNLCKKLNLLEIEEKKYDREEIGQSNLQKPLPDFEALKKEMETSQLKVKAFYYGSTDISPIAEKPTSQPYGVFKTNLPQIDSNSQNRLRKQIVMSHLNKHYPNLFTLLRLNNKEFSHTLRSLVDTFNLKADNVTFKPLQWNLVALILLKLISFKDTDIQEFLIKHDTQKVMHMMLMKYELNADYLEVISAKLVDVNNVLNNTFL